MTLLDPIIIEEGLDLESKQLTRKTVRAIIMNDKHQILLAYSTLFDDYTFPGGGIKSNESELTALKRELKEEFGAEQTEIIKPILTTQELKYGLKNNHQIYLQMSFYYLVKIHLYGPQHLVGREIDHGLSPMWVTLDQAITHNQRVMKDERHQQKGIKTALIRDNRVLTYLKENIENAQI